MRPKNLIQLKELRPKSKKLTMKSLMKYHSEEEKTTNPV